MSRSRGGRSFTTLPPILISPQRDFLEAGDHAQRGRLAAARRADQHHELALGDLEVQVADRSDVVGVDLREVNELDRGH